MIKLTGILKIFSHRSLDLHKSPPTGLSVRKASVKDIPFIARNVVDGAVDGHFHPAFAKGGDQEQFLHRNLADTITQGVWLQKLPAVYVGAKCLIYEVREEATGFLMYTELEPGSSENTPPEYELLILGITKEKRGRGYGANMLSLFLREIPPAWIIFARCYATSEQMMGMLTRYGFNHISTTLSGIKIFCLNSREC